MKTVIYIGYVIHYVALNQSSFDFDLWNFKVVV